ncbi:hypothetical protein V8C86DRAFT_2736233 [Haematococcus lacustris]
MASMVGTFTALPPCRGAAPFQQYRQLRSRSGLTRAADPDTELDARLEKLRLARGKTPYGQGAKGAGKGSKPEPAPAPAKGAKVAYDYTGESMHYEGPPHRGDLALNLLLGTTLVWLPLTAAALGRCLFVNYKFTDRRVIVQTTAPWKTEQTDIAYQEVKEVVTVARGFGLWGDMVITLRNGDKVEMRSLENFKDLKAYVLERRDALLPPDAPTGPASETSARPKGAQLTVEELMGEEPAPAAARGKGKKGFA